MLAVILLLLIGLWLFGYIHIVSFPLLDTVLFTINGQGITIWNLFILALIITALGVLPNPLRAIGFVILILWILATLGIIAFAGLPSILVIAVIVGLILALLGIV